MDCWAAWSGLSSEQRRESAVVADPWIAGQLRLQIQVLWQTEMQFRMMGLAGGMQPFDPAQLPLLAAMEPGSCCFSSAGVEAPSPLAWPGPFHKDPASLEVAVKGALGASRPQRALQPRHWKQLLHPSPHSWMDLEQSVAKLLEQTVLQAALQVAAAGQAEEEEEGAEPEGGECKVLTSRAAKRLRQRERRKLCKQGIIAGPVKASARQQQVAVGHHCVAPAPGDWVHHHQAVVAIDWVKADDGASEHSASLDSTATPATPRSSSEASNTHATSSSPTWGGARSAGGRTRQWYDVSDDSEDECLPPASDGSAEEEPLELPPPSRQATGCCTPTQLWPSTPEASPRLGPIAAPLLELQLPHMALAWSLEGL